jgi:O-antigen/teichoic acid export membrane protein
LLVSSVALAPFLASLGNVILLFGRDHPELAPSRSRLDLKAAKEVIRIGLVFFVLQLAFAVGYMSDTIVLAQILGQEAVAQYSVVTKLFLIPSTVSALIVSPLWPAYREAFTRGDMKWVASTFRRSVVIIAAVTVPTGLLLTVMSGVVFAVWVGSSFVPSSLLVLAAAASMVVISFKNALAMLLNGAQIIRLQLATAISMAIVNITFSIVLTRALGVSGVLWGSVIAALVTTIIPDMAYFKIKGVLRDRPRVATTVEGELH